MYIQDDNIMNMNDLQAEEQSSKSADKVQFLSDKDKNGKERPWREKKRKNVDYYEILELLGKEKKADRVSICNVLMEFNVTADDVMKLNKTWFCKSPLCPICSWRKSMKHSFQAVKVVNEVIRVNPKARWLFLTLSAKNLKGWELKKGLSDLTEGFRRLFKYAKVKKNLIGFMRTTEITVNKKDGSYNQHLHVLMCVSPTYFKNSENYIKQAEWTSLWKKAMKLNYDPIVRVQAVKPKMTKNENEKRTLIGAILETSKYAVKDSDYLTGDLQKDIKVVSDLEYGLYNKRLIAYGGYLKIVHEKLNLKDVENSNLINIDEEKEADDVAYKLIASWHWKMQNYVVKRQDIE